MRRLPWLPWFLLALVVVAPVIRYEGGGSSLTGFGSNTHVHRAPFLRTPGIATSATAFRVPSVIVGSTLGSQPTLPVLLIARAPFVPPEA
jgi:hypothetical protein